MKRQGVDSMSESSYYLRGQAADPLRSGATNATHLTQQRKSLSGKRLVSLALKKVSKLNPQPLARPHACLSVTIPPFPGGCPRPSSRPPPPPVIPSEPPPLWWPRPLVREELPGRHSEDSPLMRTPTLASTADMQGGPLKSRGLTCTHPSTQTHTHTCCSTCFQGIWRNEEDWGAYRSPSFDCVSSSLMVLMKAFEFFHPALEMPVSGQSVSAW